VALITPAANHGFDSLSRRLARLVHSGAENSFMAVPLDRSKWWDKKIRIANLGRGVA